MELILEKLADLFYSVFRFLFPEKRNLIESMSPQMKSTLENEVAFYQALDESEKLLFEQRVLLFLSTTNVIGKDVDIDDSDRILVAASAIIPVWGFKSWHYFNLGSVILVPHSFNDAFEYKQPDSLIQGMVGNGSLHGKMILSKPALHLGFSNDRDKRNVGIHEFAHLVDMADGDCDGFPERFSEYAFSLPWLDLVRQKTHQINKGRSNIRDYAATNSSEFFAVASEYFFERPKMLKQKHPRVYESLQRFYKQDVAEINMQVKVRKKDPCPCGSGKRYKRCCFPSK